MPVHSALTRALFSLLLATLMAGSFPAAGQASAETGQPGLSDSALLPVLDRRSGRVEALLLLESPSLAYPPVRLTPLDRVLGPATPAAALAPEPPPLLAHRQLLGGHSSLAASLSLDSRSQLALLCDGGAALATLGSLARHCLLASLENADDPLLAAGDRSLTVMGSLSLSGDLGVINLDAGRSLGRLGAEHPLDFGLPAYLRPETATTLSDPQLGNGAWYLGPALAGSERRVDRLGLSAIVNLGEDGWISLGGTLARAQLIPTRALLPGPLGWKMSELTLGGGWGAFSGAITSRVIELPGQPGHFTDLDVGVTWRTPWSGQLSIGARNLSGNATPVNAWGLPELDARGDDGETTIPYVRYRQDL